MLVSSTDLCFNSQNHVVFRMICGVSFLNVFVPGGGLKRVLNRTARKRVFSSVCCVWVASFSSVFSLFLNRRLCDDCASFCVGFPLEARGRLLEMTHHRGE